MAEEGGTAPTATAPVPPADTAHLPPLPEDGAPSTTELPPPPSREKQTSLGNHPRHRHHQARQRQPSDDVEMMGPILRRKKVVSMPLGADPRHGEFFYGDRHGPAAFVVPATALAGDSPEDRQRQRRVKVKSDGHAIFRYRQDIAGSPPTVPEDGLGPPPPRSHRQVTPPTRVRQATPTGGQSPRGGHRHHHGADSFMTGILRRKQVSLDLLAPEAAEFFGPPLEDYDEEECDLLLPVPAAPEVALDEDEAADLEAQPPAFAEEGGEEKKDDEAMKGTDEKKGSLGTIEKVATEVADEMTKAKKKLFLPLIFAPPRNPPFQGGGGQGHDALAKSGHGANAPHYPTGEHEPPPQHGVPIPRQELRNSLKAQSAAAQQLRESVGAITDGLMTDPTGNAEMLEKVKEVQRLQQQLDGGTASIRMQVLCAIGKDEVDERTEELEDVPEDREVEAFEDATPVDYFDDDGIKEEEEVIVLQGEDDITRATRKDWYITAVLFAIMCALTGIIVGWQTHLDESHSIFGTVGLACTTTCLGDTETKDFFYGDYSFGNGEIIELTTFIDPVPGDHEGAQSTGHRLARLLAKSSTDHNNGTYLEVEIVGVETGKVKWSKHLGPASQTHREMFIERVNTDGWEDPTEDHVINSYSTSTPDPELSFTMMANALSPLAEHSVLIAALIMIFVYIFILLEVIHRTLVAIFGSLIALFFYFLMHEGHTESIAALMLNMEWSTLGLLFGMMLIVGELSHTGIFEWCSVRLLVLSKGSFNRLVLLLCTLTAFSSAFLDNVTTMLLVAPVTIDMCNILGVDPRPYLIGEVLLSNVGGTATLIGDPPNIIIGSSYDEIGFVDFIIYVAPCIIFLCVPATLALVVLVYRPYFSSEKMRPLDTDKLKRTYPIYDQPRLMIAGTVTFFVILMFFMHPLHHKDTAWIALIGAFITMAFTNPHDVQDALRNHIEWDTLLFFAGLFVLVEVCALMGLLSAIGNALATYISAQPEDSQLAVAITLIIWVSAITSAFLDNIPYTATMIPVVQILADDISTITLETLAWALSFGACLGGNGTLLGASANIVTAGISTNKGFSISFLNFLYPGMLTMITTVAIANLYMLVVFVWI